MAFQFKEASSVVVGTFNIYIFTPPNLARMGLVDEGAELDLHQNLNRPGIRLRPKAGPFEWTVHPDRLIVTTEDADADCGEQVAMVIDSLPWTPIHGIGSNVKFEAGLAEVPGMADRFPLHHLREAEIVSQRTWHIALSRNETAFNLQLSVLDKSSILASNVHTPIGSHTPDQCAQIAKRFNEHNATSRELLAEIYGVEIQ